MSKKWNFLQPESTLVELDIELMVLKLLQNNSKMMCMLLFTLEIDQDVTNEDHAKLIQLRHEYGVHQVPAVTSFHNPTQESTRLHPLTKDSRSHP
jgi:hypothetical protein